VHKGAVFIVPFFIACGGAPAVDVLFWPVLRHNSVPIDMQQSCITVWIKAAVQSVQSKRYCDEI
jgi:hypothetical protein